MTKHIRNWVRSCHICRAVKAGPAQARAPQRPRTSEDPWHTVSLDVLGPYSSSAPRSRYVLVLADTFTNWVEAKTAGNTKIPAIISFLEDKFTRYGYPAVIITDNAPLYKAKKWKTYIQVNHIQHNTSAIYHQRANPVERRIQELKKTITALIQDKPGVWNKHLLSALFALRTRGTAATGVSPSDLLFGKNISRPGEWSIPPTDRPPVVPREERLEKARRQQIIYQKRLFPEPRTAPRQFAKGQQVMSRARETGNFTVKWTGPHQIIEVLGDNVYMVGCNGKMQPIHVDDLRSPPPPRENPNLDKDSFFISDGDDEGEALAEYHHEDQQEEAHQYKETRTITRTGLDSR